MTQAEARRLMLTFDLLPPSILSSNSRAHWGEKRRVVKAERERAYYSAVAFWTDATGEATFKRARISYAFTAKDKRRRDWDNILTSCKPWQDGLVDAGVIEADDTDHLEIGTMTFSRGGEDKTVITVEEIVAVLR